MPQSPRTLRAAVGLGAILALAGITACSSSEPAASPAAATTNGTVAPFTLTKDPVKAAGEAGVKMLSREGTNVHYHAHVDINLNGKPIAVPANIGIGHSSISELHTHDTSGTIHIEADEVSQFTLKQLMTEWGIKFDANCIETSCTNAENELRVYVDGQLVPNPGPTVFRDQQEIYIWYGPKDIQPTVPSTWKMQ